VSLNATSQVPPIEDLDLHLILNWTGTPSDVDFHFLEASADLFSCGDCYFGNMSPDWGVSGDIIDDPFLDYDDLADGGPENINVDELPNGTYLIVVHFYSDTGSDGIDEDRYPVEADATVEVYIGGVLRGEYGPVRLDRTDKTWNVARLEWPSETLTELGDTFMVRRGDYSWCSDGGFPFP
jgi:hypothetical protein